MTETNVDLIPPGIDLDNVVLDTLGITHDEGIDRGLAATSTDRTNALNLVEWVVHHPDNDGDDRWYVTIYSNAYEEYVVMFHYSDGQRGGKHIGPFTEAVAKAFVEAFGFAFSSAIGRDDVLHEAER